MSGLRGLFPESHGQGIVSEVVGGKLPYWIKQEDYRKIRYKKKAASSSSTEKRKTCPCKRSHSKKSIEKRSGERIRHLSNGRKKKGGGLNFSKNYRNYNKISDRENIYSLKSNAHRTFSTGSFHKRQKRFFFLFAPITIDRNCENDIIVMIHLFIESEVCMKIVVCIKQVPDTTEVKLDPKTNTLIREGVPSIINPDDKAGLEFALRMKDTYGAHVTVVSMGPPQAEIALREGLAMGADDAVLLTDRAFGGADTWATSTTIAGALKNLDYDIIITGRQAIDGDTAQVGPQIAEHLGLNQVSYVQDVKKEGDKLIVNRQFEDRYHVLEVKTPCLLTVLAEATDPRFMSVSGIWDAYEKEITTWGLDDIKDNIDVANIGLKGSPTRVRKSYPKQGKGKGILVNDVTADQAAERILATLKEKYII